MTVRDSRGRAALRRERPLRAPAHGSEEAAAAKLDAYLAEYWELGFGPG